MRFKEWIVPVIFFLFGVLIIVPYLSTIRYIDPVSELYEYIEFDDTRPNFNIFNYQTNKLHEESNYTNKNAIDCKEAQYKLLQDINEKAKLNTNSSVFDIMINYKSEDYDEILQRVYKIQENKKIYNPLRISNPSANLSPWILARLYSPLQKKDIYLYMTEEAIYLEPDSFLTEKEKIDVFQYYITLEIFNYKFRKIHGDFKFMNEYMGNNPDLIGSWDNIKILKFCANEISNNIEGCEKFRRVYRKPNSSYRDIIALQEMHQNAILKDVSSILRNILEFHKNGISVSRTSAISCLPGKDENLISKDCIIHLIEEIYVGLKICQRDYGQDKINLINCQMNGLQSYIYPTNIFLAFVRHYLKIIILKFLDR